MSPRVGADGAGMVALLAQLLGQARSVAELAVAIGEAEAAVRRRVYVLAADGLVVGAGRNPAGVVIWRLTDRGAAMAPTPDRPALPDPAPPEPPPPEPIAAVCAPPLPPKRHDLQFGKSAVPPPRPPRPAARAVPAAPPPAPVSRDGRVERLKPLTPANRRYCGWFLAAGWGWREVAHLFDLDVHELMGAFTPSGAAA